MNISHKLATTTRLPRVIFSIRLSISRLSNRYRFWRLKREVSRIERLILKFQRHTGQRYNPIKTQLTNMNEYEPNDSTPSYRSNYGGASKPASVPVILYNLDDTYLQ